MRNPGTPYVLFNLNFRVKSLFSAWFLNCFWTCYIGQVVCFDFILNSIYMSLPRGFLFSAMLWTAFEHTTLVFCFQLCFWPTFVNAICYISFLFSARFLNCFWTCYLGFLFSARFLYCFWTCYMLHWFMFIFFALENSSLIQMSF